MAGERINPERAYLRTLVAEFKLEFPFEGEYLIQTRAIEIGAKIEFENDSIGSPDNLSTHLKSSMRGASRAQIRSWPEDLQRRARGVEAMLEVLYPLDGV